MKENEIRDLLVQNLDILNQDYQFLDKEKYLPSKVGTKSFIDILAHNGKGKYIIIELKKSDTAAREAIHELFKYMEAVKENLATKTDEIELVVVSTEWDELYVPFSSLASNANLKVIGYQLFISNNNLSAKAIDIHQINEDRILSAVQMARYYETEKSLQNGIKEHCDFFDNHKIKNFILVILKTPELYRDMVIQSFHQFQMQNFGINDIEKAKQMIPDYKYMIYSVNQLLSIQQYSTILFDYEEVEEYVNEILNNDESSDLDKMEQLNQVLIEQEPFPEADYTEIGTPAKYQKFREKEGWELIEIKRFGSLSDNIMLSDDLIENEILGTAGTTGQKFSSIIDISNKASITRVKREIKNCLSDNIVWRNHILEILDTLEKEKVKQVRCSIYNPMNIVHSIYLILSRPDGLLYIPSYQIEVVTENEKKMYLGYLDGAINDVSLNEVFNKFFDGELGFMLSLTWGGYSGNNLEIVDFIGLKYKTMLITIDNNQDRFFYDYQNYKFSIMQEFDPIYYIYEKLSNKMLVEEILSFFKTHSFDASQKYNLI